MKKFFQIQILFVFLVCCFVLHSVVPGSASELYKRSYERSITSFDDKHVFDDYIPKTNVATKTLDAVFKPLIGTLNVVNGNKSHFELIKSLADKGSAQYQFETGFMYEIGTEVPQNYVKAAEYYRKAANQFYEIGVNIESSRAQNNLGLLYLEGKGVPKDLSEAFKLLLLAANCDYPKAQYNLAHMYFDGVLGITDETEALKWYRKAANGNYIPAMFFIASLYENGYKVSQSPSEAFQWYRKAAELGYAPAQTIIGDMYYSGYGITKNISGAVKWYKKAAAWKYPEAQYKLAKMYYTGEGIKKKHPKEAIKLWKEAAKNGNTDSQNALKEIGVSW